MKMQDDTQLYIFISHIKPLNNSDFIEFCLDICEKYSKKKESMIANTIFRLLIPIQPIDYEDKVIEIINKGIENEQVIWRGINLLAFIGSKNTIALAEKYLDSENKRLREIAFFCIKNIYDQMNITWWNEEEILED